MAMIPRNRAGEYRRAVLESLPYRSLPQMGLSIAFLTDPWGVYIELTEGLAKLK